jgi:hypothetical protein
MVLVAILSHYCRSAFVVFLQRFASPRNTIATDDVRIRTNRTRTRLSQWTGYALRPAHATTRVAARPTTIPFFPNRCLLSLGLPIQQLYGVILEGLDIVRVGKRIIRGCGQRLRLSTTIDVNPIPKKILGLKC